ncbi:MAG TPA: fatty acid desaturase [Rhizomicrobium sp.]
MIPASELKTASHYIAVLRPYLPREAFEPDPRHLVRIAAHLAVIFAGFVVLRETNSLWIAVVTAIVIGHSEACYVFLGHDLTHNAVVKNRGIKAALEMIIWGLILIPPSLWFRIHNQTHHAETNTLRDTDRTFLPSEETTVTRIYSRIVFPNRQTPLRHPFFLFLNFPSYILRHLVTALLPGDMKPSIVTYKPRYTPALKRRLVYEIAAIAVFQVGLFYFLHGEGWRYVLAGPVAILVASAVAMIYLLTNHILNPLCEKADPLIVSTSVIVPKFFDWLHDNVSYHTEHHLFPSMNPRYYPLVSELLQKHFPERYNRMPMAEAWRRIWAHDEFMGEPDTLGLERQDFSIAAE